MKKTLLIALCSIAVAFAACKKPVEPTPDPVDYTPTYVGNYLGQFDFNITSVNHQAQTLAFTIDNIGMDIAKGTAFNAITATVTVDNEKPWEPPRRRKPISSLSTSSSTSPTKTTISN